MSADKLNKHKVFVRPRRESNPHFKNRNLTCYPLHHEGMYVDLQNYRPKVYYNVLFSGMQYVFSV
jgi:hypothetical protein